MTAGGLLTRTRVVWADDERGRWAHALRAPDPRLAPLMYRQLLGLDQRSAAFASLLEPPRPALTLMIDLDGAISADGRALPDAWLGGLSDRYTVVGLEGRYESIDLELTPIGARRILGRPLSCLEGGVVGLEDLFGSAGRELAERLREVSDWDQRFDLMEEFLLARAIAGPAATPAVQWAYARLQATAGRVRIEALADELGCSRRHLTDRFRIELGLAPKAIARMMRFHDVCRAVRLKPRRWADIAAEAGFCDQSHLNREFRELAGTTPVDFLARCLPGGGVVGDGLPFVQDSG